MIHVDHFRPGQAFSPRFIFRELPVGDVSTTRPNPLSCNRRPCGRVRNTSGHRCTAEFRTATGTARNTCRTSNVPLADRTARRTRGSCPGWTTWLQCSAPRWSGEHHRGNGKCEARNQNVKMGNEPPISSPSVTLATSLPPFPTGVNLFSSDSWQPAGCQPRPACPLRP